MKKRNFLIFLVFFFPFFLLAKNLPPSISLSFSPSVKANQEIEILVSISNLKSNTPYDLKLAIEKEKVLSEIFNENVKKWQDSYYYLKNFFLGPSFEGKLKLRLKKDFLFFEGKANLILKVRESGKSKSIQYQKEINVLKAEIENKKSPEKENLLASLPKLQKEKNNFKFPILVAIFWALFSTSLILILKINLKS